MYYIEIVEAGVGSKQYSYETWAEIMQAISILEKDMADGTVSDFTVWKED